MRFPMWSMRFFIDIILPAALRPWGRLSFLTEMSTRDISWRGRRSVHRADRLNTFMCWLSRNPGSLKPPLQTRNRIALTVTFTFICKRLITFRVLRVCISVIGTVLYYYFGDILCIICYIITYSMEQSPSWEANRFSASQEILLILWNTKVH